MASKKSEKIRNIHECKLCNYITLDKKDYNKHLMTRKHKMLVNANEMLVEKSEDDFVCGCGKSYKHESSYYRHTKKCSSIKIINTDHIDTNIHESSSDSVSKELVNILIKQTEELKEIIIQKDKQMFEMAKEAKMVNSHNTTNNNQFNLNFFLNETCKDAMNIKDFIKSIQLSVQDLESVGELGYAEGISRMFIKGLNDLEVTKRPIHCSDLKRETLHIKDNDRWERDNANQDKIKKAINDLSNKNIMLLDDWQKENPGYDQYDNKKNDIYLKMMIQAMGPVDEKSKKHDFGKIIRKIAKNTIIDK